MCIRDRSLPTLLGGAAIGATQNAPGDFTIAFVPAGESRTIRVRSFIDANFTGASLVNDAEITGGSDVPGGPDALDVDSTPGDNATPDDLANDDDIADTNGGDDQDPALVPISIVDLALIKTIVTPGPYNFGDEVEFLITVVNQGTVPAANILVHDYVPEGFSFSPALNPAWSFTESTAFGDTYSTLISDVVNPGATVTRTITLTVLEVQEVSGSTYTNVAEIGALTDLAGDDISDLDIDSPADMNPFNDAGGAVETASDDVVDGDGTGAVGDTNPGTDEDNSDPALVEIVDFALIKTVESDGPFFVGDLVPFTITIFNQGNVAGTDILIYDFIPAAFDFDAASNPNWTVDADNTASFVFDDVLGIGEATQVEILLVLNGEDLSTEGLTNIAEIGQVFNLGGFNISGFDVDSTPAVS